MALAELPRKIVAVAGEDRIAFLQGLVSNDVTAAGGGHAVYAALLTAQGRYVADFFIAATDDTLLLDCDVGQAPVVAAKLGRFRLASRVEVTVLAWRVYAAWPDVPEVPAGAVFFPDPRDACLGFRVLSDVALAPTADVAAYARHRLAHAVPDTADFEPEQTLLLEAGFERLNGVSFSKGCYMGQELTARTKYRGLVKRDLVKVAVPCVLPPPGTPIWAEGREVGVLRTGVGREAMAFVRRDALHLPLMCGGEKLAIAR